MSLEFVCAREFPITRDEFCEICGLSQSEFVRDLIDGHVAMNCFPTMRRSNKFRYSNLIDLFEYLLFKRMLSEGHSVVECASAAEFGAETVLAIIENRSEDDLQICQIEIRDSFTTDWFQDIFEIDRADARRSELVLADFCESIEHLWLFALDSVLNIFHRERGRIPRRFYEVKSS